MRLSSDQIDRILQVLDITPWLMYVGCLLSGHGFWLDMLDPISGEEWEECVLCGRRRNVRKQDKP